MSMIDIGGGKYRDTKYNIDDVVIFKEGTAEEMVVGVIRLIYENPDDGSIRYDLSTSPYQDREGIREEDILCKLYDTAMVCIQHIKS